MPGRRAVPGDAGTPGNAETPAETPAETLEPAAQARAICLKLLTGRPRSRAELAAALRKRGIPEDVGAPVLDRLTEVGLVDDTAFAEAAVHSGHTYRGLGRRALSAELRHRGVAEHVARDAVAAVAPEDEEQRARELVRRRIRTTSPAKDQATTARRLMGMLGRKGYSEGLSWRVVREELGGDPGEDVESALD